MEIDRRTGAVTYFSSVHDGASGVPSAEGTLSSTEAVARVAELVDTSDARITTERDVWGVPRITVTVDRGIRDLLPDVDRIVVDARTGDVIAATTA